MQISFKRVDLQPVFSFIKLFCCDYDLPLKYTINDIDRFDSVVKSLKIYFRLGFKFRFEWRFSLLKLY